MAYPPLDEASKSLRVKFYRSHVDPQLLHELLQRSDMRAWLQTLGVIALTIMPPVWSD